ncbi:MAG: HupE/UreJ family protein [Halioglobus sp.]
MTRLSLYLLALIVLWSAPTQADPQSKSFSHWRVSDQQVSATFTIARRELSRLTTQVAAAELPHTWQQHLESKVRLASTAPCKIQHSDIIPSNEAYARVRIRWQCPDQAESLKITLNLMFDQVSSHVHFANYRLPDDSRKEQLFSQSRRQQVLVTTATPEAFASGAAAIVSTYLGFGFEHILIGLDHIAFLLALLLLPYARHQLLWIITGFTLGHSATLSLSTLGLVTTNTLLIEAVIGLSIALVAIENIAIYSPHRQRIAHTVAGLLLALAALSQIRGSQVPGLALLGLALFSWCYLQLGDSPDRSRRMRPYFTALFGLVHGFGFASVLMEVGLPASSRPLALLGFNLGVELGQFVIVLIFLCIGWLARRILQGRQALASELLSAALCGLGVYWFLQRLYF